MGPEARVSELIDCWVDQRLRRGEIEPLTAKCQRGNLATFARLIGDPRAHELAVAHVQLWRERAGLAPSTMRTRLSELRGFCEWLADEGMMRPLPPKAMRLPREPRRLPRGMPARDVALLLGTVPNARARLIVLLMVQEGLRRIEVHRLDMPDVDTGQRALFVQGKGRHERVVPMSDETVDAVERYLDEWPARAMDPLIRSFRDGRSRVSPGFVGHLMAEWMYQAEVKRGPWDGRSAHALRHTTATDMANGGADLRDVQAALGHRSVKSTEVYLGWVSLPDLRRAMGGRRYAGAAPEL